MFKKIYEKYYVNKRINELNQDRIKEWYELSEVFKEKKDIDSIILGSSHGVNGLIASIIFDNENAFNLCTNSQDLYGSYQMMQLCLTKHNLKNIIMTYSLFSNSFMLDFIKTERDKCYLNEICFNLESRYEKSSYDKKSKKLIELYIKYYLKNKCQETEFRDNYGDKGGGKKRSYFKNDMTTERRVAGHMKYNNSDDNENIWLEKMIDICRQKDINIKVVIMPARDDYKQEAFKYGTYNELFHNVLQICRTRNVHLISYFEEEIEDKYFGDFDHLTYDGAVFLSNKLKKDMQDGK